MAVLIPDEKWLVLLIKIIFLAGAKRNRLSSGTSNAPYRWWSLIRKPRRKVGSPWKAWMLIQLLEPFHSRKVNQRGKEWSPQKLLPEDSIKPAEVPFTEKDSWGFRKRKDWFSANGKNCQIRGTPKNSNSNRENYFSPILIFLGGILTSFNGFNSLLANP